MTTPRRLTILLALLLAIVVATTAQAQGTTKQVALVIQYPDSVYTEIVTVPSDATAAAVLEAANAPVGLADYGFGPAVCNINAVGCPTEDCFCDAEHFWAYYHLAGNAWADATTGIGDYTPGDRSVEGFAWSGFDENFAPTVKPPVLTFDEIEDSQTPPPPAEIPEPATILLLGSGLVGLAAYARRRRSQASA